MYQINIITDNDMLMVPDSIKAKQLAHDLNRFVTNYYNDLVSNNLTHLIRGYNLSINLMLAYYSDIKDKVEPILDKFDRLDPQDPQRAKIGSEMADKYNSKLLKYFKDTKKNMNLNKILGLTDSCKVDNFTSLFEDRYLYEHLKWRKLEDLISALKAYRINPKSVEDQQFFAQEILSSILMNTNTTIALIPQFLDTYKEYQNVQYFKISDSNKQTLQMQNDNDDELPKLEVFSLDDLFM